MLLKRNKKILSCISNESNNMGEINIFWVNSYGVMDAIRQAIKDNFDKKLVQLSKKSYRIL